MFFYIVLIVKKILHATAVKFTTSPDLCAHRTWKN